MRTQIHGKSELNLRDNCLAFNLAEFEILFKDIGHSPTQVAIARLFHQPGVSATILGPRTVKQLQSCLNATSLKLSQETLKRLDSIWLGSGGEAPETYAW